MKYITLNQLTNKIECSQLIMSGFNRCDFTYKCLLFIHETTPSKMTKIGYLFQLAKALSSFDAFWLQVDSDEFQFLSSGFREFGANYIRSILVVIPAFVQDKLIRNLKKITKRFPFFF